MIPVFWLFLGGATALTAEWTWRRRTGSPSGLRPPIGLRVGMWVTSFAVTGALLWWLFDLSDVFRFSAYLSAGRFAEAQAYIPHPIIQINASWVFALAVVGTIGIGADMLWHPPRYTGFTLGRDVPEEVRAAAIRRVPIWGGILVGLGVLTVLVFGYLWAVAR